MFRILENTQGTAGKEYILAVFSVAALGLGGFQMFGDSAEMALVGQNEGSAVSTTVAAAVTPGDVTSTANAAEGNVGCLTDDMCVTEVLDCNPDTGICTVRLEDGSTTTVSNEVLAAMLGGTIDEDGNFIYDGVGDIIEVAGDGYGVYRDVQNGIWGAIGSGLGWVARGAGAVLGGIAYGIGWVAKEVIWDGAAWLGRGAWNVGGAILGGIGDGLSWLGDRVPGWVGGIASAVDWFLPGDGFLGWHGAIGQTFLNPLNLIPGVGHISSRFIGGPLADRMTEQGLDGFLPGNGLMPGDILDGVLPGHGFTGRDGFIARLANPGIVAGPPGFLLWDHFMGERTSDAIGSAIDSVGAFLNMPDQINQQNERIEELQEQLEAANNHTHPVEPIDVTDVYVELESNTGLGPLNAQEKALVSHKAQSFEQDFQAVLHNLNNDNDPSNDVVSYDSLTDQQRQEYFTFFMAMEINKQRNE